MWNINGWNIGNDNNTLDTSDNNTVLCDTVSTVMLLKLLPIFTHITHAYQYFSFPIDFVSSIPTLKHYHHKNGDEYILYSV